MTLRSRDPRTGLIPGVVSLCLLAWTLMLFGFGHPASAQTGLDQARSTMGGVYTESQADHGEETYMGVCVGCHPAGTYTGETFKTTWTGRPLSDLFEQIKEKMPKNDPGSLSPEQTAELVSYILKINKVPPGKTDLPADIDPLKDIRIEMPGARSKGKQ